MEEYMKQVRSLLYVVIFLCIVSFSGACLAQEKATKDECVAKVKEAAAMVKEIGLDAALAKISDPKGPFQWKDSYVFCYNLDGVVLAHPNTKFVGRSMIDLKDSNGKMFVAEFMSIAKTAGEGWVSNTWPKPGEKEPSPKNSFVYRVPGENVVAVAGVYE